jgi:quercetin dioxygenase-like cupin family protein
MESLKEKTLPQLILLDKKEQHKVYQVKGVAGITMPEHISTKEAVVIIQEGEVVLNIQNQNYNLKQNDVFIIPARVKHFLSIHKDFKAVVIMDIDSEIEFIN